VGLKAYQNKRLFSKTPEPRGTRPKKSSGPLRFVVQLHEATRLHYDFRIEAGGVFKSWAVPKGPSMNHLDQRLAVQVEDHPLEYGSFEGIIPKGNYGAGTVMVWDAGTLNERNSKTREESEAAIKKGLEEGHVTLLLEGHKLHGEFALVRLKKGDSKSWLLLKKRDAFAKYTDVTRQNKSILSGRSMQEIADESHKEGDVWLPGKGPKVKRSEIKMPEPPAAHTFLKKKATAARFESAKAGKAENEKNLPTSIKPMMPVMSDELFDNTNWLFEGTADGTRVLAAIKPGQVKLYSRQALSLNRKFPKIVAELEKIKGQLLLDGEVVGERYLVHDVLHLNGKNLRLLPLIERKKLLATLPVDSRDYTLGDGHDLAKKLASSAHEWMIAKEISSPYLSKVSPAWLKIKLETKEKNESARPILTHLDKIYWPNDKYTKGDLIEYYRLISKTILPHLKDRPESLHRHPNGIKGESFFHKDMTGYLPRFVKTTQIYSESSEKSISYALCQNEASLLYLINLGCIELNPWLSRVDSLDHPDFSVIDLDPDKNNFSDIIKVALKVHSILTERKIKGFCKTSGATGLHVCVPLAAKTTYDESRDFAFELCKKVHDIFPKFTSLERTPAKRRGKIYLDYLQNRRGATLAAPYCVRPQPGATVSAPLTWSELEAAKVRPGDFTIKNMAKRIENVGDLWAQMLLNHKGG
jgi:DNA ligase D-like protein (predicted polymerase)/DNA ligase D-like protein (predicted 3'-phosphoesterase)